MDKSLTQLGVTLQGTCLFLRQIKLIPDFPVIGSLYTNSTKKCDDGFVYTKSTLKEWQLVAVVTSFYYYLSFSTKKANDSLESGNATALF